MTTTSRQFVLPNMKSSLLQGGKIASVIKELQVAEEKGRDESTTMYKSKFYKNSKDIYIKGDTVNSRLTSREAVMQERSYSKRDSSLYRRECVDTASSKQYQECSGSSSGVSSKSNTPRLSEGSQKKAVHHKSSRPVSSSSSSPGSRRGTLPGRIASTSSASRSLGASLPIQSFHPSLVDLTDTDSDSANSVGVGRNKPVIRGDQRLEQEDNSDNLSLNLSTSLTESESDQEQLVDAADEKTITSHLQRRTGVYDHPSEELHATTKNTKHCPTETGLAAKSFQKTATERSEKLLTKTQIQLSAPSTNTKYPNQTTKELSVQSLPQLLRCSKPSGYVGFGSLPDQVYRRAVRKGFEFSLMVVGESGLGKSTLVNSMFLTDLYHSSHRSMVERTTDIETHNVILEEGGVRLSLTVVDTPGFGDSVDNTDCWEPVIEYIENQFDKFLDAEQRVNRVQPEDTRVHVCLYFIAPTGHGLRQLDIQAMKRLHDKVNIVPVIGKSDSCTKEELNKFKITILKELNEHGIDIYKFPHTGNSQIDAMRERIPFAVVGSNTCIEDAEGKRVLGRKYPWGVVNIEDKSHCDFSMLRNLLLSHHMQDLKDVTNTIHYENYRTRKLEDIKGEESMNIHPLAQMELKEREHLEKVLRMEEEMEVVFRSKIAEKEGRLRMEEEREQLNINKEKENIEKMREEFNRRKADFKTEVDRWRKEQPAGFRSVKSEESLVGRKKKFGLDRVLNFRIGRN